MEETAIEQASASPARRWGVIFVWALLLGMLAIFGFGLINANRQPLEIGQPGPDFELTSFDGQPFNTAEMRGQVVLVNIWASWCVTCKDEARELEQAYQMFKDRGVVFLGVDWSDTETKALEYLDTYGITYPNGPDLGGRIYRAYRVRGVPETYVLDAEGKLAAVKIGAFASLQEIVTTLENALAR